MTKCTIIARRINDGILYLTVQPKKASASISFQAGQYAALSFRGENRRKSPVRCFSIVSSATNTREIEFAIRILGDFTEALAHQPLGTKVYLQGPYGEFCVDESQDSRLVLVAGGIGITPCLSIIRTASALNIKLPILLLYSNRSGHKIPFHDEIRTLQKSNKYFKAAFFVTDSSTIPPESRQMFSGRIASEHIKQVVTNSYAGSTYFICGPKQFMDTTENMLTSEGVGENQIITESFTQASKVSFANSLNSRTATYAFSAGLLVLMIGGIAFLDLSRYIPAAQALAAEHSTTTETKTAPTNSIDSTGSSTTSSGSNKTSSSDRSASTSTGSSSTTGNSSTTNNSSSSSDYQSPVSSVS